MAVVIAIILQGPSFEGEMTLTTVTKVSIAHSPTGTQGEVYLASGKRVSMRLWRDEPPTQDKPRRKHGYEVVGYVISGRAELEIEGQTVRLDGAGGTRG
jgi:quercetin dioxygenase-like cupin family protein